MVEEPVVEQEIQEEEAPMAEENTKEKLNKGLEKTKTGFFAKIAKIAVGKSKIDEDFLDNLEEVLITSDVGVETTVKIIQNLEKRVQQDKYINTSELNSILKEEISFLFKDKEELSKDNNINIKPYVIMVVGINGVGKTTTIGKLANKYKLLGKKVLLGAADTFRAAAIEQLEVLAKRVGVPVIKQTMGSDPASVAYDTLQSGISSGADIVIIDTAGRLHNQVNLMNELSKIKKVMTKLVDDAPHEVILVLDASTGQNAIEQAKQFIEVTDIDCIALTKLDGTAKGGVVIGISDKFNIPIKYIGVGEKLEDIQIFNKHDFVNSLFSENQIK